VFSKKRSEVNRMNFGKILDDWEKAEIKSSTSSDVEHHWSRALDQYGDGDKDAADGNTSAKHKKKVTLHVKRKHPIQDEIDLHGLNAKEAEELFVGFIEESKRIGYRKVKVIHGRGLHSDKDAVLKPLLHSWLDQRQLFWELCPSDQGGSGATWVWLLKD
jgi:DNA-nicking Smr family endonuclease